MEGTHVMCIGHMFLCLSSGVENITLSNIYGRLNLPMFSLRMGLLTLMEIPFLIALAVLYPLALHNWGTRSSLSLWSKLCCHVQVPFQRAICNCCWTGMSKVRNQRSRRTEGREQRNSKTYLSTQIKPKQRGMAGLKTKFYDDKSHIVLTADKVVVMVTVHRLLQQSQELGGTTKHVQAYYNRSDQCDTVLLNITVPQVYWGRTRHLVGSG